MNDRKQKYLILFLCMLFVFMGLKAQDVDMFTYSHLGPEEGLCSQRIYSICQTNDGAVWWSTKMDIERYNGQNIKHYQLSTDKGYSNFAGRSIKMHIGVNDSLLYAFDNHGHIAVYDEEQDEFRLQVDMSKLMEGSVVLNDILVTSDGWWFAMREGVFFLRDQQLTAVAKGMFTNTIVKTKRSMLFCTREGVYSCPADRVPKSNMQMTKLLPYNVESGYYDSMYDKVWLGGFLQGLQIYTPNADGMLTAHELMGDAICNPVRSICPYDDQTMLVGIDGLGVYKVTRRMESGQYRSSLLFDANEGKEGVLHGNGVYSVIRDAWDNIVVGSYSGGIDIARPVGSTPAIFQHIRDNRQSLQNDHVNCVAQFPSGVLVMGTDNGISLHNPFNRQWTHTCERAVVLSLCLTPQGTMLASTYGKGVYEIGEGGQAQQRYTKQNGVLKDDHVYKLLYDRHGNLWMGCLDGDLVQKTASGCHYYPIKNVQDMIQLPNGSIAVGTADGIKLIDPQKGEVKELDYSKGVHDVNRYVLTLFVNDGKELWIGTDGGGVYVYNLKMGNCSQVTKADGLPSNVVYSIAKDYKGRMLVATEEGLAFVDPHHPQQVFCSNYCYGIEREYSARAVIKLHNNHMLYGTTTGALIINPDNVQELNYTAKLKLVGVSCSDNDGAMFKKRVHDMLAEKKLRLHYTERTFLLTFESINLRNQFDIVYQYKVGNGEWSKPTDEQTIRFTNMEAGTHPLLLRCISRTCGTVLDEVKLTIIVSEPWWNSWWMWLFYIGLILLAFYGAWHVYHLHTKYMRLVLSDLNLNPAFQDVATEEEAPSALVTPQEEETAPIPEPDVEDGSEFIARVTKLVADHLADANFNIDRLCRELAMSRTLFYLKLKTYTGKSPQDFIRIIRLERAAALLRNGSSVTDAAALAGFENPKYFSTVFKKYFGVSPSKYC